MTKDDHISGIGVRYLYEHAPVVLLRVDPTGKVVDANRFAHDIIGTDPIHKMIREVFLSFGHNPDLDEWKKEPDKGRLLNISTKSGLPETFVFYFIPEGDGFLALGGMDFHETRSLRKEMISLNNQLNALTRELQKKNHELSELNQVKNHFLGMAAHDLRKPVSAILSYSEFLIDEAAGVLTEEQTGFLRIIHESTDLMRALIDDFLDIAVIESGRLSLNTTLTDIRDPLDKSVRLNLPMAGKKGVTLQVTVDDSVPRIIMDGPKIEQVFNNLIGNAVEHSAPDSRVCIRITSFDDGLEARVEDDGPGLTPEETERLFAPFERGRASKTAGFKSTGLGLAISGKIVEAHQGKIGVALKSGKGAILFFRLPGKPEKKGEPN